jgi:hypothetical protein
MAMHRGERGEFRGERGERGEYDDRYRERYQTAEDRDRVGWRDADDGDRERRFGRFGRWDEDRGRDDDRPRYTGWGGQSGSQSGNMSDNRMRDDRGMSDNMFREQTGYRGDEMYGRDRDRDRDYGGTLGHVDRPYAQQRGSQYGTNGPFGGHRGKGPSGYMRSDDRIREDVCDILTDDDHVDASHIEISVKNGEVTLSGTVPDRRSKRMAEDAIEHARGVKDVINNIRIQDDRREASGNGGSRMQHAQSVSSSPDKDTENNGRRPRA